MKNTTAFSEKPLDVHEIKISTPNDSALFEDNQMSTRQLRAKDP